MRRTKEFKEISNTLVDELIERVLKVQGNEDTMKAKTALINNLEKLIYPIAIS